MNNTQYLRLRAASAKRLAKKWGHHTDKAIRNHAYKTEIKTRRLLLISLNLDQYAQDLFKKGTK